MSDNLKAFLRAWLDWAMADAPDSDRCTDRNPNSFDRECGLCSNTHAFEELALDVYPHYTGALEDELGEQFRAAGLSKGYPFGQYVYDEDSEFGTHHCNLNRLAWVRTQLGE